MWVVQCDYPHVFYDSMFKSKIMKVNRIILFFILLLLQMATIEAQEFIPYKKVIDPGIDDPSKQWCYMAKSTTVIGMPFQSEEAGITQVTYDGSLYTTFAELGFFYGKNNTSLMARQKTFYEGWMPIVQYDWKDNGVQYELETFASALDDGEVLNFVKIKMKNFSSGNQDADFTSVVRACYPDNREGIVKGFSSDNVFEIRDGKVLRDGKLLYTFPAGAKNEAVNGVPYRKSFSGSDYNINEETAVALARYHFSMKSGEEKELVFKMPQVPVDANQISVIRAIDQADYSFYRDRTISYWKEKVENKIRYEIPEKQFQDGLKASIVHLLLATRTIKGKKTVTDGLPYPNFFLTSSPEHLMACLMMGLNDYAKMIILNAVSYQQPNGRYADIALEHDNGTPPVAQGHIMYNLANYFFFTRDVSTMKEVYPSLQKAVDFIATEIAKNKYGLLPPAVPYDNEMIDGHYTTNNVWALLGIRSAVRIANELGNKKDADDWSALEQTYRKNIMKGIEVSVHADGYVPTGLYPFLTGKAARRGFDEYMTNADWENMLLAYPSELLSPDDPMVKGTLQHIRKEYAEGIMTYRHGLYLHQYITANMIEQYMVGGNTKQALIDFYHILLHCGSTYEGFENLVRPWTDRQVPSCPPPHAWASSKIAFTIRNFLVYEYGGKFGLEPEERNLYLFSVLSPAWVQPGKRLVIQEAPTEMGTVSARMDFKEGGATVTIRKNFQQQPGAIRIRIPYFKKLVRFTTDAGKSCVEDGCLVLSPDVRTVQIDWQDIPMRGVSEELLAAYRACTTFEGVDEKGCAILKEGKAFLLPAEKQNKEEILSFNLVLKNFLHEFDRRRVEKLKQGYEQYMIDIPSIR